MKTLKLLFLLMITGMVFNSCTVIYDDLETSFDDSFMVEQMLTDYDLWYVDYHRTTGTGEIPFMTKAFTLSFHNGVLYANNNIVDIGRTGNGFGIDVGTYDVFNGLLETHHDLDNYNDFEVYQIAANELKLYNYRENVTYYLIGYQVQNFDYDKLFYENIEYFLQEFVAWEKISTVGGASNAFDDENYLQFTPENVTTFYSSHDNIGTNIAAINWNFAGGYEVFDVRGYEDVKILTLNYDNGDREEFELNVINERIRLYHIDTATTYDFSGQGFIQFLKGKTKTTKPAGRNNNRKRVKIVRKLKDRRNLK